VLGINEPAVTIKNIENAIIDYAWNHGLMSADLPQDYTGKQIAVVGSGPAGLACAAQLNKVSLSLSHGNLETVKDRIKLVLVGVKHSSHDTLHLEPISLSLFVSVSLCLTVTWKQ